MSDTIDLGLVTAYGNAKVGGYTGTEAQFNDLMANLPTYTANALTYKNQAAASATAANDAADRAEAIVGGQFVSYGQEQGLTAAQKQQARNNISAETRNTNLIDNSWFFINSRGQTSYSESNQITLDRWFFVSGTTEAVITPFYGGTHTVSITNSTSTNVTFYQRISSDTVKSLAEQTVTLSINITSLSSGATWYARVRWLADDSTTISNLTTAVFSGRGIKTITGTCPSNVGYAFVDVYGANGTVRFDRIKLELGDASTLSTDPAPLLAEEHLRCVSFTEAISDKYTGVPYGSRVNPNLLVNPWFPSALCINQRGFSGTVSAAGWTVDMWHKATAYGTVGLSSGGITLTTTTGSEFADFRQYLPDTIFKLKTGRVYTLSYMTSGGVVESASFILPTTWPTVATSVLSKTMTYIQLAVSIRPTHGTILIQLRSMGTATDYPSVTLRAVKLEEGAVSTLAFENPLTREEEWRKCRQFYRRIPRNASFARIGVAQNATTANFPNITDGAVMYKTPTVTMTGTTNVWNGINTAVTALSVSQASMGDMTLVATTSGLTAGQAVLLNPASGAYIELDAQPTLG